MISFRKRRVWISSIGAIAALTATAFQLGFANPAAPMSRDDAVRDVSAPVVFDRPERTIEVGLHIVNIHQFSMKDKLYTVEGWYWLRWPEAIQEIIDREQIDLDKIVEFKNHVETSSFAVEMDTSKPVDLPDNRKYQLFKFSGRFYVTDLNLRKSPFETFDLPVMIETRPDVLSCEAEDPECVYLKPDAHNEPALVGEFAEINGFKLIATSIKPYIHQYATNFGIGPPSAFSRVEYDVRYQTDFWAAFTQNVLPLLIVVAFVLVSPRLPSSMGDVRLAIPATALLTLIFMQQTYRSEIPALSYLTFMDWLYAFAYLISMSLFILFCWGTYRYSEASEADRPAVEARIDRIDSRFQFLAIVGLVLTALVAWLV